VAIIRLLSQTLDRLYPAPRISILPPPALPGDRREHSRLGLMAAVASAAWGCKDESESGWLGALEGAKENPLHVACVWRTCCTLGVYSPNGAPRFAAKRTFDGSAGADN